MRGSFRWWVILFGVGHDSDIKALTLADNVKRAAIAPTNTINAVKPPIVLCFVRRG